MPPECAIVGSGDGEVRLRETGELEECASSRPLRLLGAMRKHVRGLRVSVLVAQLERSVAMSSVPRFDNLPPVDKPFTQVDGVGAVCCLVRLAASRQHQPQKLATSYSSATSPPTFSITLCAASLRLTAPHCHTSAGIVHDGPFRLRRSAYVMPV